jgi:hypothetical protein
LLRRRLRLPLSVVVAGLQTRSFAYALRRSNERSVRDLPDNLRPRPVFNCPAIESTTYTLFSI